MRGLARFREPAALFLLFFLVLAPAGAGGRQEEAAGSGNGASVDYVGIAAVMIRDGNYERAESALSRVDPENPDVDLPRYHTLQGLLSLRTGEDERAVDAFQRAVAAGQRDSSLYAYLAQAHYRAGDHQSAR